ncbi:MAG: molybdate ABC transporter substrate-binding protein [Armatimonadetes bacterium]|nr:molybdate ABC transporter substrate-binding protein [Armatimonadota bacterium]
MEGAKRRSRCLHLLALAALAAGAARAAAPPRAITVSSAAGLSLALPEIARDFTRKTGIRVDLNFGATQKLAAQIQQGAPVDLFVAADRASIEDLARRKLVVPGTARTYAFGRLALCVPPGSRVKLADLHNLAAPEIRRIAIANPQHAPYGVAARQALQAGGLWETLKERIVTGDTVRQAVQYVETGTVDAGIVAYSLVVTSKLRHALVPEKLHRPIEQMVCVVRGTRREAEARRFAAFLRREGKGVLRRYGFRVAER